MIEVAVKKNFKNNNYFEYNFKTDADKIVLFGPSGSGKSNLIKMIVGLIDPDEGRIKVNGNVYFDEKGRKLPIYKRRIGYLPQEYTLFPHMNIEENILYGAKRHKIKINNKQYNELLNKLELVNKLFLYPHQLSGGEKQRVAFARAILINPDLLLFDEPFSSLDKVIRDKLRDTVIDIIDETGKNAVFVTHDFEDAFIMGKEVFVINNGRIIEHGSADKIFNHPEYLETAKILNIRNIWKKNDFIKIFNIHPNINENFIAVKEENIFINPDFECIKVKAKVKKVKRKGLHYEIVLQNGDLKIISVKPEINLSQDEFIEIGFLEKDLLFLKEGVN